MKVLDWAKEISKALSLKEKPCDNDFRWRTLRSEIEHSHIHDECVYFIRCGDFVKIGKSKFKILNSRIEALAIGNPFPLILIGVVSGGLKAERNCHEEFSHLHHKGEWFRYDASIANFIADKQLQKSILNA